MMDNRILTLMICGGIMLLMYIAILALILADLWAGVRKAKVDLILYDVENDVVF